MPDVQKISVVIPAHNEEVTLSEFLPHLLSIPLIGEVLVINDGSTDGTGETAVRLGARVINHRTRRGNGAAVKTGLHQAVHALVLIVDADGQHTIEDIRAVLMAPFDYDLVIGARSFHWYRFRDFGNLCLSRIASIMSGVTIGDLTSGLRRIRKDIALNFKYLYPEGFSFPTTSTILFITSGYAVTFMPIPNRPRPDHASPSKLNPIYEGLRFLSLIYRIILLSYPLRFFAPVGIFLMLLGIAWDVRTLQLTAQISAGGALLFLSGLTLLLFGTIADQLSQIRKSLSQTSHD